MPDAPGIGVALMMALMPSSGAEQRTVADGPACHVPASLPVPHVERPRHADEVRRMAVGGYTLALSWTPHYCAGKGEGGGTQCDRRIGRFGFVLHGLWPEGKGGRGWPQYCAAAPILPRRLLAENFCMTPSVQLMQHEWAKHGTCMASRPQDDFDRARSLYGRGRRPDMRALVGDKGLTAGRLADAFVRVNPALRAGMIRVQAARSGQLSEVWICMDMAFAPTRCPVGKAGVPSSARITIRTGY